MNPELKVIASSLPKKAAIAEFKSQTVAVDHDGYDCRPAAESDIETVVQRIGVYVMPVVDPGRA
jgi:hypothetical protein